MDRTRWERIQALFHGAADLPKSEQGEFLKNMCGGDDSIRSEVLAMLEEDAAGSSLLDRDLAHLAHHMLDSDPSDSFAFKKLGPYRIKQILGEGGMGVVYLAEREDLGNRVAIKILRDAWLSPARRERFVSEQRTLAQLNHPFIARLYDAETLDDGTPWFVMEYVEGVSLTDYCREHGLPIEERLRLFRPVCEAVQYAHAHAVIHRDLKPSNILVTREGTVKLLDFGIAKQLDALDSPADQTRTGLRLMTPAYASPEQVRGERVGIQTDVYSLGAVLYELLAGHLPFDLSDSTPAQAETIITERDPGKPSAQAGKNSGRDASSAAAHSASAASWADLDVLCLTAMHKDLQRRYRSVEALMRDVDHYLNGEPLEARPDTIRYRVAKFVRRNRRSVSAAAAAVVVVVGLVVFFTVRLAKARNAAIAEAARTQRVQRFMQDLFQGGDEDVGPAENLRVVTLLDRGVHQARSLDAEPAVQAELFETLGTSYEQLGKYDQAESLLKSALEKRKSLYGADTAEVAESLVMLGLLRSDQARFDDAEKLVREGMEMSKRHLPPNHPAVAKATSNFGRVLMERGSYSAAIPVLEEAVRLQSAPGGVTGDLLSSLTELANCQFYTGHLAESDAINRRVLEMDRRTFGDRHPNVGEDLINLGTVQFEWGHYAEAEKYDRQALEIMQVWFGKDHPETSSVLTILGRVLIAEGKLTEASDQLHEALTIQERVYGTSHPRVASTVSELGKIALQQKNLDGAEADFTRAEKIWTAVYNGKHYYIAGARANLGDVYMERKEFARAEASFRDALQMYTETLPTGHELTGIARVRLGRALLREKRYGDSEAESRAGYDILIKESHPPQKWVQFAREDFVEEYDALNRPDKAAEFRAELAKPASGAAPAARN